MATPVDRREFLGAISLAAVAASAGSARAQRKRPRGPVAVSSFNGLATVAKARDMLRDGADPLDAVVEGVRIVEDDPEDMSVGLGGLPNEDGVVELDSSVMHGPTHRAGAVAALRNIKNPASVAREVARRTDHVLLVGEGALRFARHLGFKEQDLTTEKSRQAWLNWKSKLNRDDDWLQPDEYDLPGSAEPQASVPVPFTTGTIHCSAVTPTGDLAGTTTTSGLSWKLPGRVGDSPIIGAGLYTDNEIGSAGATGRGEAVIQICGSHTVVQRMEAGDSPSDACIYALKKIADRTRTKRLLTSKGKPAFNVIFYALRKDGAYGSAAMWEGRKFSVSDTLGARHEDCTYLFSRSER